MSAIEILQTLIQSVDDELWNILPVQLRNDLLFLAYGGR